MKMQNEHPLSDEVLELAELALRAGKPYMVYNNSIYYLDKADVYFFSTHVEAKSFAADNISDHDRFHVLPFNSIPDLLAKIPYGEQFNQSPINDPDVSGLYNRDGNAFTDALIEHFESTTISEQLNFKLMNQENLQYLSDNLKYMGFGETLKADLEKNLQEGNPEFKLEFFNEIGNKGFEATLNFRKSESTDMYFFNNYQATLHRSNGDKVEQTFYLNKGKGVTAKEAFNLLDGRAVHKDLVTKDGQEYKAWLQLDFNNKKENGFEVKQFHENYGYDLKAAVGKFAVSELKDPDTEKVLMASLQKGNVQAVTIEVNGESHRMFLEANPQFKNVTLYDGHMKMVSKESMGKFQVTMENGAKAVKEDMTDDKKKELKQKPDEQKAEKKNGKTLLPKKRESKGKGLGVS